MTLDAVLTGLVKDVEKLKGELEVVKRKQTFAPLNADMSKTTTIDGGSIMASRPFIQVVPETGTADDLTTITNGNDGKMIVIGLQDPGDTITVLDTDNISLRSGSSYVLDDVGDSLLFIYKGLTSKWEQIGGGGTSGPPEAHAPTHLEGGDDPLTSTTPVADGVPQADIDGFIAIGWLSAAENTVLGRETAGTGAVEEIAFTAAARQLADDATFADMLTTLGITVYDEATLHAAADLRYGQLGAGNLWTQLNEFEDGIAIDQLTTNGHALAAYRNLAAGDTTGALVNFTIDNSGDDQALLYLQQDGAGDIISAWDGATEVFGVEDGGRVVVTQIGTTGSALSALRDLAAASTDGPVVSFVQDNTGDDQPTLLVQQDGTGDIVSFFDGATEVFDVKDGGRVAITQIGTTGNALAITRNLASGSTDSPVVSIVQDHASDDQPVLYLRQDAGAVAPALVLDNSYLFVDAAETLGVFGDGSAGASIYLNGAAGAVRQLGFMSNGSLRWIMRVTNDAESGSNAGSNFSFHSRTDAGGALSDSLLINRQNNQVTMPGSLIVGVSAAAAAQIHAYQPSLGNAVIILQSAATNDDPTTVTYQQRVTTTGAGSTTYATIAIPSNYAAFIEYKVVARRTGGSSGATNDCGAGFGYVHAFNNGGTVTVQSHLGGPTFSWRGTAGPAINATNSGGNVILTVAGNATTNIVWHATYTVKMVST